MELLWDFWGPKKNGLQNKWLTGVVSHLICGVITSRGPPCVCMNSLDITLPQPWGSSGPADSYTMTKGVYESRRISAAMDK